VILLPLGISKPGEEKGNIKDRKKAINYIPAWG